jgi:hypothetical protein
MLCRAMITAEPSVADTCTPLCHITKCGLLAARCCGFASHEHYYSIFSIQVKHPCKSIYIKLKYNVLLRETIPQWPPPNNNTLKFFYEDEQSLSPNSVWTSQMLPSLRSNTGSFAPCYRSVLNAWEYQELTFFFSKG